MACGAPAPRSVGVLFNPALASFVTSHVTDIDYLAVIPDRAWLDRGVDAADRFALLPAAMEIIERASDVVPLVMHSIGMSICSADIFDEEYVDQLALWRMRLACPWASEHLSFTRIGSGHETNAALALPVPYDLEVLELLIPRIKSIRARLGVDFLLENNVSYVTFGDDDLSEAEFLNTLSAETGCGILLDLHNVYTNAVNHGFDATEFLLSLDLGAVREIHVAGGDEMMGFHTDSHTGAVLEEVWRLLDAIAGRVPNLRGVTYEFHESSWDSLRADGVKAQLTRARAILDARTGH